MLPLVLLAALTLAVAKISTREQYLESENQMDKLRFLSVLLSRNASIAAFDSYREIELWGSRRRCVM